MGAGDQMDGCSVCSDEFALEDNPLVYCDGQGCNVCVHKACYGIGSIPTGDWFCGKCVFLQQQSGASTEAGGNSTSGGADAEKRTVSCQLCPSKEGALKPTLDGKWAHVVCALYIREALFKDTDIMEPIVTHQIPKDRFQQVCFICLAEGSETDARYGACSNCEKPGCRKAFHVTCAQRKGLLCEITRKNNKAQVIYSAYCSDHIPPVDSGVVDNARFRKIAPYPRISQPSPTSQAERGSPSSGYSTPNNPSKSPVPVSQAAVPAAPATTVTSAITTTATATTTPSDQTQTPPVVSGEPDNQRSSSIKSNASVGSSGTTESSVDSGIHSASVPGDRVSVAAVATGQQQEEQRVIRKPPKKAFAARSLEADNSSMGVRRMDGPANPPGPVATPNAFLSQVPPLPGSGALSDPTGRYYANNPFASPHEMPNQFDLSRPSSGPLAGTAMTPGKLQENARMSPYLPGKGFPGQPVDRPTPPPLRKRALSPSILDNETLTISSLIERTIERATTSTASMPPIAAPFSSAGVRPSGDDSSNSPHAAGGGGAPPKNEPASKKSKKAPKEPKADPRRSGNTATIKDLLASSNMSPQQRQSVHSPTPDATKAPTPKPKPQTSSVSGLSAFAAGNMDVERTNHSGSPFSSNRDRAVISPKSVLTKQQDDRHRYAVEKVQNYLNNNVPSDGQVAVDLQQRPLPNSISPAAPPPTGGAKGKRKAQQDERGRAPTGKSAPANPQQYAAPLSSDMMSQRPPGPVYSNAPRSGDDHSRKTNGYMNGNTELHDDDVDTPAGAQAFDSFMMALSTFGMSAAHQSAVNSHPTAATTLDGFFRMQKELNILKQKVGELEGLKAFYLTQVQSLRTLASKHQADGAYPMVQPTMPEEVARLLSVLGDPTGIPDDHHRHTKPFPVENASDGLSARLHEPTGPGSRDSSQQRSSRDSRPDSRLPASASSQMGPVGGGGFHGQPHGLMHTSQSPSSTPKPSSRSRGGANGGGGGNGGMSNREPERDRDREYVNGTAHSAASSNRRAGQYPHIDHMDGVASGVISTPAPVVSAPQLINMSNMAGAPFLLQNPQLYSMIDPRMFGMMPGQAGFFPQSYAQGMGGFIPSSNPADYAGLGRMHTPTSMSGRYQEDGNGASSNPSQQHSSMKREQYEMSRES